MPLLLSEVYDALREAGASEDKARSAATAIADYHKDPFRGLPSSGGRGMKGWPPGQPLPTTLLVALSFSCWIHFLYGLLNLLEGSRSFLVQHTSRVGQTRSHACRENVRPGGFAGWFTTVKAPKRGHSARTKPKTPWAVSLKQEPLDTVSRCSSRNPLPSGSGGCQNRLIVIEAKLDTVAGRLTTMETLLTQSRLEMRTLLGIIIALAAGILWAVV